MIFNKSDDELMKLIAGGSEPAFRQLFDRHASRVLGLCCRFFGDRSRGEDMTQEVWMKVLRAASSYRGEGKFVSWLMTVARTTCLSALRSESNQRKTEYLDAVDSEPVDTERESIEDVMVRSNSVAEIKAKIDALPQGQRVVLTLWMAGDVSYEDISRELGMTVSSIKSLLFRAKQNLEKELRMGT